MNIPLFGKTLSVSVSDATRVSDLRRVFGVTSDSIDVDTRTVTGQIEAYTKCPTLQTAIKIKSDAHSNLKIWAKDIYDNPVYNSTVISDLKKMRMFNEFEDSFIFNHRLKTYVSVFGKAYLLKEEIVGFNDFNYYIIPNEIIEEVFTTTRSELFEKKVDYYRINMISESMRLERDEVVVIHGLNIGSYGDSLSVSPLVSLNEPIKTLLAIQQMSTELIADGGARGIIGLGAKDVDMLLADSMDEEYQSMQEKLSKHGGLRGKFKYLISRGMGNYTSLTSKIIDMQLPENALEATLRIYGQFGIPNAYTDKASRFKALPEARKELYTTCVNIEGNYIYSQLVKLKGIPERDWEYKPDWSHLDFYQESLKESAVAFQQAASACVPLLINGIYSKDELRKFLDPYIK